MKCVVCVLICVVSVVSGANILAVVPAISISHYVMFEALIKGLAQRGHNITVVTTFPQDTQVDNMHEISVKSLMEEKVNSMKFTIFPMIPHKTITDVAGLVEHIESTRGVLNVIGVSELLSSGTNFDVIIYEVFLEDVFLSITNKFPAPVIGMSSCTMFPWVPDRFGIPDNTANVPVFNTPHTTNMYLYQRMYNTFIKVAFKLIYWRYFEPKMTEVVRQHFGSDTPPVAQLVKNVSLYFTNTHFTLFGAQPYPPQVVDVSGIHLKIAKPLPQFIHTAPLKPTAHNTNRHLRRSRNNQSFTLAPKQAHPIKRLMSSGKEFRTVYRLRQ